MLNMREQAIKQILGWVGDDVDREGLRDTPKRVSNAWDELFVGYKLDPKDVIKTFEQGACDEMVIMKDIEIYSMCEHHMLPFFGKAHVAYIPDGRIIGLSKLARVVEIYARRLQVQERLTTQVTNALMQYLKPKGAACVIEAKHFCCMARGIGKQQSSMITSSLEGVFREQPVRQEFLSLIK